MGIFISKHSSAVDCGHARSEMRSKPFFRGVSTPWNLAFLEDIQRHTRLTLIQFAESSAQFRSKTVLIHNFSSLTQGLCYLTGLDLKAVATLTWNGSHAFGVIRNTILNNVQSDVAETTATRGSNDRRMCFDRRGVILAVLDEFQSLYFANVIYCSKNGSRSIPYLAGNLVNTLISHKFHLYMDTCALQFVRR